MKAKSTTAAKSLLGMFNVQAEEELAVEVEDSDTELDTNSVGFANAIKNIVTKCRAN